jgi:type IV secretion system protein VirD4
MPNESVMILIKVCAIMFSVLGFITVIAHQYSLDSIRRKQVGHGQHGTARFASKSEVQKTFKIISYKPDKWRNSAESSKLPQGTIVGMRKSNINIFRWLKLRIMKTNDTASKIQAIVDDGDVHTLMIGAAGVGKTACFLYPNLEYACASGMSFLTTDTKGDLARSYGNIAKSYGYNVAVIDLRNPTRSDSFNMLHLVNKYMEQYQKTKRLEDKAKAERYAKITAKTIIYSGDGDASSYGQNAFFYDSAEGLLTAVILLVAEFCEPEQKHIISVFKMVQDLLAAPPQGINTKSKNYFHILMQHLPDTHKAKWFAGAALNTSDQAMSSVMSTVLSRLNAFLDSEMEQILCFDTALDAEKFCNTKSALFLIMPEEDNTKYFLISLIVQQLYREILSVADEKGGKLENRVMFYLDEIGTIPKIDSAEMMFSAARSRRISIVAIIQSLAQLEKNYGKEGASIIIDNCQVTLFGGFAPNSETAETMSKNLGDQTILSGSITRSANDNSQSLQMLSRPLMTPDELKSMPRFHFIVAKTGCNPMKTKLELFFKWGIQFIGDYAVPEKPERKVKYAGRNELFHRLKINESKINSVTVKTAVGGMPPDLNQETIRKMKSSIKEAKQNEFKKDK